MKKGIGWPIGIAVILFGTVAANIGVILLTKDDPSFAIEPDYYRKAVAWDSTQALAARSAALAWQVAAHVTSSDGGAAVLTLDLTDTTGAAVRSVRLAGALLHVARANDVQTVTFTETETGRYVATVSMARTGVWELRLTADRGADRFVQTVRLDTGEPPDAADPDLPHGP